MNCGDHNFIQITQQTKLRVALVVSSVSSQSCFSCQACRAVLFNKLDTAKMHELDTSNVQWRRAIEALEARAPPQTVWRLWLIVYRTELKVSLCA